MSEPRSRFCAEGHSGPCVNAGDCCSWKCDICEPVDEEAIERNEIAKRERIAEANEY